MNDIKFKTLRIKNFLSFGNKEQVINLDQTGTTFIIGENLDEGGSSGSGKSSIIAAMSLALFDKIPSNVKKERMINRFNDAKKTQMYVELEFSAGSTEWKIRRERGMKTEPSLWENGVEVAPASIKNLNEKLEAILGFSYELFKNLVFFNGKNTPFLDLPGGDQRSFIEELIKITMLARKAAALKLKQKDTDANIKIQLALIDQRKAINSQFQKKLDDAASKADQWETARANEVAKLQAQIAEAKDLKLPCTDEELAELATLKADVVALESALKDSNREKAAAVTTITKLRGEHDHLADAKCPYCLQGFDSQEKIKDVLGKIAEQSTIEATTAALTDELMTELTPLKERYIELASRVNPLEQTRIKGLIAKIPVLEAQLAAKEQADNPHLAALEALAASSTEEVDTSELDALKKLAAHQAILLKLLTDKNSYIRKGLIAKSLPFLNKKIGEYTEALGLPHVVLFQADLSVQITQLGRELDHGNLSNGEKVRLNLALCLAFRDTMTFMKSKVNLLLTDEIDGGSLDEQAVYNMINLLKRKAWDDKLEVLIISHRPEFDGRCDRTITVRKEGGFSSLIFGIE